MFLKACQCGIKAAIFIAIYFSENRRVSPKEISEEIDSLQTFKVKLATFNHLIPHFELEEPLVY
ncbi:hypothetical protein [Winogradskyella psychrotolerans]|uniref:hypothetical protein n=1 Tax=Winogradskyella psychrotolerans TaxID=1344585 RepID=UPI001C06BEEF|nr:hypothetical protein [Winogradskyella psychrotolerans]MBU2927911.1 hypothetical protein [Winogradskyella psychrotolerans]